MAKAVHSAIKNISFTPASESRPAEWVVVKRGKHSGTTINSHHASEAGAVARAAELNAMGFSDAVFVAQKAGAA